MLPLLMLEIALNPQNLAKVGLSVRDPLREDAGARTLPRLGFELSSSQLF